VAKNKGKHKSQKAKDVAPAEQFTSWTSKAFQALRPHALKIGAVVVGLVAVLSGFTIYSSVKQRRDTGATRAFADVMEILRTPVIPEDPASPAPEPKPGDRPRFKSEKEKRETALAKLDTIEKEYGSSGVARQVTIVRAGILYDLGRWDEAIEAYRKALSGATGEMGFVTREGLGYAIEAKGLETAKTDAEKAKAMFSEALREFEALAPEETSPHRDLALYHQARVKALQGDQGSDRALQEDPGEVPHLADPRRRREPPRDARRTELTSMIRSPFVLAAVLAISAAGCNGFPDPVDPWELSETREIGLPVLSFLWKKVVNDRTMDHEPQEFASPAVRDEAGVLYVGSLGRDFFALKTQTGQIVWKQPIGAVSSQPLVDRGRIFVGTDDGVLLALDTFDGSVRWRYDTKGAIHKQPVIAGNVIVFATDADHVVALDRETGMWRWQYDRETPEEFTIRGHAGVAVSGDHVYTGFADGFVVALTLTKGEVVWVRSVAGDAKQFVDVDTTPVIDRGTLYVASAAGGLYALDPADGTEKWRVPIQSVGGVTVEGDRLYVAAADEGLHCLDRGGHILWRQGMFRAGDPSPPVIHGEYLILTTSEKGLFVVDKRSGELHESWNPGAGVAADPTISGDKLYVLSNGGILYAMLLREF
jgi:outer membrane protein assembly factor BamB